VKTYTAATAARELGVHPSLVTHWCRKGRIRATKHGKAWLITERSLRAFERTRRPRGRPSPSPERNAAIVAAVASGESQRVVAARFGISQPHVSQIVRSARADADD